MKTPMTELFEKYGHLLPDVQKEFLDKEALTQSLPTNPVSDFTDSELKLHEILEDFGVSKIAHEQAFKLIAQLSNPVSEQKVVLPIDFEATLETIIRRDMGNDGHENRKSFDAAQSVMEYIKHQLSQNKPEEGKNEAVGFANFIYNHATHGYLITDSQLHSERKDGQQYYVPMKSCWATIEELFSIYLNRNNK